MTEKEFRGNPDTRNQLQAIISNTVYRDAVSIIITKRRILEQSLEITNIDGSSRQSLRLFNQRLGMEDLIMQLHEMVHPMPVPDPGPPESTFGADKEYQKLQEFYDRQNQ